MTVMLALFVTACGGGGGGGGGSAGAGSAARIPRPGDEAGQTYFAGGSGIVRQARDTGDALGPEVGGNSLSIIDKNGIVPGKENPNDNYLLGANGMGEDSKNNIRIGVSADHQYLMTIAMDNGKRDIGGIKADEFSIHGNGVVTHSTKALYKGKPVEYDGYKANQLLIFGGAYDGTATGKSNVLTYTNYGYWAHYLAGSNKLAFDREYDNGGNLKEVAPAGDAFYLVSDNAKKVSPAVQTYKGGVVGLAYDYNSGDTKSASLLGTASLTVKNANAADLALAFNNSFTINATNLAINNNGAISNNNSTAFTHSGNPGNGVTFGTAPLNSGKGIVQGQFYGGPKIAGAEGVGRFKYGDDEKGVIGSFGVK